MYIPGTQSHRKTTRDPPPPPSPPPPPPSGEMRPGTAMFIGIGVLCFLILIFGFYLVSKWHSSSPPRTHADEQTTRSYERWAAAISGKGKTARLEQRNHHQNNPEQYLPPYTPRRPASTLSGSTVVGGDDHLNIELPSRPSAAHLS